MRRIGVAAAMLGLIGSGLAAASTAAAAPAGSVASPPSATKTTTLTSSTSVTLKKVSRTRKYTKGGCAAYEKINKPQLTKGGTAKARAAFNAKINSYVRSAVDRLLTSVLDLAIDGHANGNSCSPSTDKANYVSVNVTGSVYKNRFASVAMRVTFSYAYGASSCRDYYKTFTFDTKKASWPKLSAFASSNHKQLELSLLSKLGEYAEPYNFGNVVSPVLPSGYSLAKEAWTVGSKGVRVFSASGDHGRSCAAGPKNVTLAWRDVLKPGDTAGAKKTYTRVPVRWDLDSPIEARATVTVKGRAVSAKWCSGGTCTTTYYGVRNGRTWTPAWGRYTTQGTVHGAPVSVVFTSTKNSAKPRAVAYAIYD